MAEQVVVRQGGIGLSGLLTVAFIVLKLCGVIAWSWWWVFAPLWIPAALLIGVLLIGLLIGLLIVAIASVVK